MSPHCEKSRDPADLFGGRVWRAPHRDRILRGSLAVLLFGVALAVLARKADAQISPLVPPVPCCTGHWQSCPSAAAACIPLPHVYLGDPELATDPTTAQAWPLTVHEAIRVALGNSEVVRNLGLVEARSEVDIVRGLITRYDPLQAQALANAEWGIFDPLWTTTMQWERIDIPPGTSFSGIGNRPPELDTADFFTSLEQLLPGGTRVRADYVTDYLFNPNHPPSLDPNPQYFSYVQFGLNQPILQGHGVDVTMAPIRIAAAEAERTDWRFKQEMLALVRSIETSYWALYSEQQNLRALDEALPLFREVVRVRKEQARGTAGTETEVARAVSEMLLFEQRRLDVLSNIAEQQLVLRNLMGLSPNDGRYLALVALPATTPPFQTVGDAITTAVNQRPDVLRQRISVYVAQQERVLARDALKPKLDFNAFWRINGLGEDLPESWDVIGQNDFHDWQLGVTFQVPLGRRRGRANLRAAELEIQKERALLDQTAHQASFEVADAYRRIIWLNQQLRVSSERVDALTQWRKGAQAHFENPPPGVSTVFALEMYLDNLRDFVEASIKANAIVADHNSALARLEEVKGTLLDVRLIEVLGDGTCDVPEDLPAPELQVPDWMMPPPAEIRGQSPPPDSGSSIASPPPIMMAPAVNQPGWRKIEHTPNEIQLQPPAVSSDSSIKTAPTEPAPIDSAPIVLSPRMNQPGWRKIERSPEEIQLQAPVVSPDSSIESAPIESSPIESAPIAMSPGVNQPGWRKIERLPEAIQLQRPSTESTSSIQSSTIAIPTAVSQSEWSALARSPAVIQLQSSERDARNSTESVPIAIPTVVNKPGWRKTHRLPAEQGQVSPPDSSSSTESAPVAAPTVAKPTWRKIER